MTEVTVVIAFGAGLASFLTPCVLPLVPVYFASLAGPDILNSSGSTERRLTLFFHSLSFVAGFTIVFTLMGTGAALLGLAIGAHIGLIRQLAGVLLILLGLFLLLSLKIPWLNFEKSLSMKGKTNSSYLRSFFTGGVFSLGWTPCVGPILGGILTLALGTETAWRGAYLLVAYSLGLGLPFLAMGIAFDFFRPLLKKIARYSFIIYIVSGVLIIAVGILVLTNRLVLFAI
jgi:cytochrome c-type biogenesis protein